MKKFYISAAFTLLSLSANAQKSRNYIKISGAEKKMHVYSIENRENADTILIKTYDVMCGCDGIGVPAPDNTKTPQGTFYISHKTPVHKYHELLWLSDLGARKKVAGYKNGFIAIHGMPPDQVGKYKKCSHGCIRLANDEMAELYDMIRIGTMVTIER